MPGASLPRAALVALLLSGPALAGCLEQPATPVGTPTPTVTPTPTPTPPAAAPQAEPLRLLERGQQSGAGATERAFESEEAWANFWSEHVSNRIPPPPPPEVDFAKERVLAVVLADRSNACYSVRISNATTFPAEGATRVSYVEHTPPQGAVCADVITSPFEFVAIPQRETVVSFHRETRSGEPPGGAPGAGSGAGGPGGVGSGSPSAPGRAGPGSGDPGTPDGAGGSAGASDPAGDVTFTPLEAGAQSGVSEERFVVVDDAETWAALWSEHADRGGEPSAAQAPQGPPGVDFEKDRVVAVFLGEAPNTCHGVRIGGLQRGDDGRVTVDVLVRRPTPGMMCGQAMVTPFDMVLVSREDAPGSLRFERTEMRAG